MDAPVPAVEVAGDGDGAGIRRPDGERRPVGAVEGRGMCSQTLVQLLVPPFAGEVEVELAERRCKRVRIADRDRVPLRIRDLELVPERQRRPGHASGEDPVAMDPAKLHRLEGLRDDDDGPGARTECAHDARPPQSDDRRAGRAVRDVREREKPLDRAGNRHVWRGPLQPPTQEPEIVARPAREPTARV